MHFQMLLKNNAKNLNAFGGAKIILNFKQENPATHRLDIEKKLLYIQSWNQKSKKDFQTLLIL